MLLTDDLPNEETLKAIEDSFDHPEHSKRFSSPDELREWLNSINNQDVICDHPDKETVKTIADARNGTGVSKKYDNSDE